MTTSDIILSAKNVRFKDLVCQSSLKTELDKQGYAGKGGFFPFLCSEFQKNFPEISPENIYYSTGIGSDAYYFNKTTLAVCPFNYLGVIMGNTIRPSDLVKLIQKTEEEVKNKEFGYSLSCLQDGLRVEYINMLVEQIEGIPNLYSLFVDSYFSSDYGFSALNPKVLDKIIESKTEAEKQETSKALKDLPDILTVYRGEGSNSTPANTALSWSLNINVANFFASRLGYEGGQILVGEVEKSKVVEYDDGRNEKEIVVRPNDVKIVDTISLFGLDSLDTLTPPILETYHKFRDNLLKQDFATKSKVHGAEHENRVLFLSLVVGEYLGLSASDKKILATAAIYHDVKRVSDSIEPEHGLKSREYYEQRVKKVDPLVSFLIEYHCLPDEDAYAEIKRNRVLSKNRSKATHLFNIFKDVDALDRVRFGIKDLDVQQLRVKEAIEFTLLARITLEQLKLKSD